jgi:putative flavoprotein involved in K+ transport
MPTTETLIVGAGQAGLALSRHLTDAGRDHVLVERDRVGEQWGVRRWPSLVLLTPNWLNRLPGMAPHPDPDGFMPASELAGVLADYARSFGAPVHEHTTVERVVRRGEDYRVDTDGGSWRARHVVIATGAAQLPRVPAVAADVPDGVAQLHASDYRTPAELPAGGVLIVGAGATGQQLAAELRAAGRRVVLAVGGHSRMVRRHRGRDAFAWLAAIGELDRHIDDVRDPVAARRGRSFAITGADGGQDLDLLRLRRAGVELAGRLEGFDGRRARFRDDLPATLADTERSFRRTLGRIDAAIKLRGWSAFLPPAQHPEPVLGIDGLRELDLREFGTVLWATGYRRAYPWLHVPVLDRGGDIVHRLGATPAPGLHVLGMRFQVRRSSHFLGRVGRDAAELAARISSRTSNVVPAAA